MLFLSDLSRQECHRYTTVNQVSTMQLLGWVMDETNVCLRRQLLLFLSSHGLNTRIRTFRVRGGFRKHLYCSEYTEGFTRPEFSRTRTSTSTQSTRYDLRAAHVRGEMKHEFRTVQVRGEIKPGLHTVCVRKPSDFALLRVRGPNRRINSHGSTCADTNLFLAEFTKRGRCDNKQSGTQHQ